MTFAELLSSMDVIDRYVDWLLFRLVNGRASTIRLDRRVQVGMQYERDLHKRGVNLGVRRIAGEKGMFWDVDVRRKQRRWAEYIVDRIQSGKPLPVPWSESKRRRGVRRERTGVRPVGRSH